MALKPLKPSKRNRNQQRNLKPLPQPLRPLPPKSLSRPAPLPPKAT